MKVCRIRNFKKTFEVTIRFDGTEAEYLSHAIGNLSKWSQTKDLTDSLGYPSYTREGSKLLNQLNDKAFWTHWRPNFLDRCFSPEGKFSDSDKPETR